MYYYIDLANRGEEIYLRPIAGLKAIEEAVGDYDFNDSGNYEIEYGIDYDCKVYCESIELAHNSDLIEAIVEKVSKLFTEAECPEAEECESTVTTEKPE